MTIKKDILDAQHSIAHGVYVISTVFKERVNAMTAAWVARASFEPPLLTVAVGHARFTHSMITSSGVLAVNVLGSDNLETGRHFGLKTGRRTDKFKDVPYDVKVTGAPILRDCIAWMDCRVVDSVEAGDHTVFVAEILEAGVLRRQADTLIYSREDFFR